MTGRLAGLCLERCPDATWRMGIEWLKGSWRAILGSRHWSRAAHASRT